MPQTPLFSSKRERNDIFIAFVVLLLFGFGIYALGFTDRDDDDVEMASVTQADGRLRATADVFNVSAVLAKDQRREAQPIPEKLPIQPVVLTTSSPATGEYEPVPVITTEAIAAETPVIVAPVIPVPQTVPVPTTPTVSAQSGRPVTAGRDDPTTTNLALGKKDIATAAEPTPSREIQKTTKSVKPALPAGSCTVIAGSFNSASNRNTMRRELIKDGYQVVAGQLNNGLYYAGIPVGCLDKPTRKRVETELKAQYEVDAWVLRQ